MIPLNKAIPIIENSTTSIGCPPTKYPTVVPDIAHHIINIINVLLLIVIPPLLVCSLTSYVLYTSL